MRRGRPKFLAFPVLGAAALLLVAGAGPVLAGGRVLTPMDVVTIRIVIAPDLDTTARVDEDGTIAFPILAGSRPCG